MQLSIPVGAALLSIYSNMKFVYVAVYMLQHPIITTALLVGVFVAVGILVSPGPLIAGTL